jgi:three-Cys-motif partner protein
MPGKLKNYNTCELRQMAIEIPASYEGREHAFVKHMVLKDYLERLFYIVGNSLDVLKLDEIVYVDCFAGPWQDNTAELDGSSVGIAIEKMLKTRLGLQKIKKVVKFRGIFIERDPESFERLKSFLSRKASDHKIELMALNGEFQDLRSEILDRCPSNAFAFFFIDPLGWKTVGVEVLRPLLLRRNSEYLINFMFDFVNRFTQQEELSEQIHDLFGKIPEPNGVANRARYLVNLYSANLRSILKSTDRDAYSANIPVLDRSKDRVKYHLVYLTGHPKGVIEFSSVSEKQSKKQRLLHATTKQKRKEENTGQISFLEPSAEETKDHSPLIDDLKAEALILTEIELFEGSMKVTLARFAEMMEKFDCYPSTILEAVKRLLDQKKIRNADATSSRRVWHVDPKKNERLVLVNDCA